MRKAYLALGLAVLWSIALLVAAAVAPVYQGSSASSSASESSRSPTVTVDEQPTVTEGTLVEVNGTGVLVVVGIPLLAVGAVAASLWRRRAQGKGGVGPFAWTVVALLSLVTLVAMLSIGIFVIPVTGLLILACVFTLGAPDPVAVSASSRGAVASPSA